MMNCRLLRRKTAVKQLYIGLEYKSSVSGKPRGFMQQPDFLQSIYELIGAGWCQAQPLCNSGYVNHRMIKQHIHYLMTICSGPTQLIGDERDYLPACAIWQQPFALLPGLHERRPSEKKPASPPSHLYSELLEAFHNIQLDAA